MSKAAPKRVLVFGGSGFIGNSVARRLDQVGYDVTTVGRRAFSDDSGSRHRIADLLHPTSYWDMLEETDAVICLASATLPASDVDACVTEVHDHVGGSVELIKASAAAGVGDFIFGSSAGTVYGDVALDAAPSCEHDQTRPRNMYGVSKLAIEGYLRVVCAESAMVGTSLRLSNPYGATQTAARGQGFIAAALQACTNDKPLTIWGDGSTVRDYVHIDDVALAFEATLAEQPTATEINIGSGTSVSLLEVVDLISRFAGREIDVRFETGRSVDVPAVRLNVALAKSSLSWQPLISLEAGLQSLVG